LIIAEIDRLARSVAFISNLMESGVEFRWEGRPAKQPLLRAFSPVAKREGSDQPIRFELPSTSLVNRGALCPADRYSGALAEPWPRHRGHPEPARNSQFTFVSY
jgi:hypothetical protein